jgi:hypothetical protein
MLPIRLSWPWSKPAPQIEESLNHEIARVLWEREIDPDTEEAGRIIEGVHREILETAPVSWLEDVRKRGTTALRRQRRYQRGFERRLDKVWGPALDRLDLLIMLSHDSGEAVAKREYEAASAASDHVFLALIPLHARACQTAREIMCLLRGGYAAGAHSRWRSLHELAVVALFIREHGNETAERYLLHDAVESYHAMQGYVAHQERLDLEPALDDEIRVVTEKYLALRERFGPAFCKDYGWAATALGGVRATFAAIEAKVSLDHWRPYYRMASHAVHGGPKGLFFNIGMPAAGERSLMTGASNAGLSDPGQGAALSLLQITSATLTHRPTMEDLIVVKALDLLAREIIDKLTVAHGYVERRSAEHAAKRVPSIDR